MAEFRVTAPRDTSAMGSLYGVPAWQESAMALPPQVSQFPDAPPSRQDQAFQTSIDRWKQLAKDVFFAPSDALKAFNEQPTFMNALGVMPMGGIGKMPIRPPTGIRAYHGSPYDFDRFDLSKIGTGEGAQSYGHGLYFAENPKTATAYRNTLAEPKISVTDSQGTRYDPLTHKDGGVRDAAGFLAESGGDINHAIAEWRAFSAKYPNEDRITRAGSVLNGWKDRGFEFSPGGKMYEVNINAKPEQFLDWDRPIGQQNPEVRAALERFNLSPDRQGVGVLSQVGQRANLDTFYPAGTMGRGNAETVAASYGLRDAGIPGIRYLDQGSRVGSGIAGSEAEALVREFGSLDNALKEAQTRTQGARTSEVKDYWSKRLGELEKYPKPTSNYVLFNDKIIDILRKYGLAGGMAGAGAASQDQSSQ